MAGPGAPRTDAEKGTARLAVAFTAAGLRAIGLPDEELSTFPAEFREGPHARSELLGDADANAPGFALRFGARRGAPKSPLIAGTLADFEGTLWYSPRHEPARAQGG